MRETHALVFTTRNGRPIEPRNINRAFGIRCGRAGVRRITIHDTRRTCGSLLAALDVHPRVAMAILRHGPVPLGDGDDQGEDDDTGGQLYETTRGRFHVRNRPLT